MAQRASVASTGAGELFQLLRDGRPRTRSELAALSGLARSTVGIRIDELSEVGLIAELGSRVHSGGRPSSRVAMQPAARLLLAVDCGASHHTVVITDLSGGMLARHQQRRAIADGPVAVLESVDRIARELLASIGRHPADLVAAGIGLPGPVDHATGVVAAGIGLPESIEFPGRRPVDPPVMPGWEGFDVPAWIGEHLGVPALVDNDVNVMAIGERAVAHPDASELMFVKVATGIGAGIIVGGELQRGAQGTAGDIGHVRAWSGGEVPCGCGKTGCLEAVASGSAIARRLNRDGVDARSSADVAALVRRGDKRAIEAVAQAARDIGEVLAACVSLVNPSIIVLGGSMANAAGVLVDGIREVISARGKPLAIAHLEIVVSRAGEDAAVIGAAALAAERALAPTSIDAIIHRGRAAGTTRSSLRAPSHGGARGG